MNADLAYLASAALGAGIAFVAFQGENRALVCALAALVGIMFAGAIDMEKRGDDAHLAKVLDPLANVLAVVIGMPNQPISDNPCPPESNLGRYGDSARYDGSILITGSPEFVGRVVTALNRLYDTNSYRYAKALRHIEERNLRPGRWAQVSGRHTLITPRASTRSCTFLAGTIVHEGAHVIHGSGHGPVYAAQAQALREMGEPRAAAEAERMAANY